MLTVSGCRDISVGESWERVGVEPSDTGDKHLPHAAAGQRDRAVKRFHR